MEKNPHEKKEMINEDSEEKCNIFVPKFRCDDCDEASVSFINKINKNVIG